MGFAAGIALSMAMIAYVTAQQLIFRAPLGGYSATAQNPTSLWQLSDVADGAETPAPGEVLKWNGSQWEAGSDEIGPPGESLPTGLIAAFNLSNCPAGWSDYGAAEGRMIVGLGGSFSTLEGTGGAATVNLDIPAHNHGGATAGHTLTIAEMPSHDHNALPYSELDSVPVNPGATVDVRGMTGDGAGPFVTVAQGGNQPHSHGVNADGAVSETLDVMNPYIVLKFCRKGG